jgi:hypothetical protein
MIRVLYAGGVPVTRDVIKVAIDQFKGFVGDYVEQADCLGVIASGRYDVLVLEDTPNPDETFALVNQLSLQDTRIPIVIVCDETTVKRFQQDKKRLGISAFLRRPLEALEIFRLLNRLREKIRTTDLSPS